MAKKIKHADEKISVRMLRDYTIEGVQYLTNHAISFPADIAKFLEESGIADSAKPAVEFVISEGAELVEHIAVLIEEEFEPEDQKKTEGQEETEDKDSQETSQETA